jgi:hypothetical protein
VRGSRSSTQHTQAGWCDCRTAARNCKCVPEPMLGRRQTVRSDTCRVQLAAANLAGIGAGVVCVGVSPSHLPSCMLPSMAGAHQESQKPHQWRASV